MVLLGAIFEKIFQVAKSKKAPFQIQQTSQLSGIFIFFKN